MATDIIVVIQLYHLLRVPKALIRIISLPKVITEETVFAVDAPQVNTMTKKECQGAVVAEKDMHASIEELQFELNVRSELIQVPKQLPDVLNVQQGFIIPKKLKLVASNV